MRPPSAAVTIATVLLLAPPAEAQQRGDWNSRATHAAMPQALDLVAVPPQALPAAASR